MRWVVVAASCALFGCAPVSRLSKTEYAPGISSAPSAGPSSIEYTFGVIPLHNAVRLFETYQPLIDEINRQVSGFTVRFATAKTFPDYETKVRSRQLHFVMMNSNLVIPTEERGYDIIGQTSDRLRGVIVTRKGAVIRTPAGLKGATITFATLTDLAGTMMPKVLLRQGGLDIGHDAKLKYVSSPESALLNVSIGMSAAGCVSEGSWRAFQKQHPVEAQALQVRWRTDSLVGLGILARHDIPREHVRAVLHALFTLKDTARGREILEAMRVTSFSPATSASYDRVWEFLNDYRRWFGHTPALGDSE